MNNTRILVIGGSGFLGSYLSRFLHGYTKEFLLTYSSNVEAANSPNFTFCDVSDQESVLELQSFRPDLIIHAAAQTNMRACEENPEKAYAINVLGSRWVAQLAKESQAKLVYISTDAVFEGENCLYSEESIARPSTVYGQTKLDGEKEVQLLSQEALIARTNIFGLAPSDQHRTLLSDIIKTFEKKEVFGGFSDATFCPLSVQVFIELLFQLLDKNAQGIVHLVSDSVMSKFDFSKKVASCFGFDENLVQERSIELISSKIKYPKYLNLENKKMKHILNRSIPDLETMLKACRESIF